MTTIGDIVLLYLTYICIYKANLDSIRTFGYRAPDAACSLLSSLQPNRSVRIVDVGAGTGLVGERLSDAGYTHITAFDTSIDMLAIARDKMCYEDQIIGDITSISEDSPLNGSFDGKLCSKQLCHQSHFRKIIMCTQ